MDNLPDFITAYLPPSLLSNLTGYLPTDVLTTLTSHGRTYWSIYRYLAPFYSQAFSAVSTAQSLFLPFLNQIRQSPDVASVLLLGILLFVSLKVLNILRRAVMFWVMLVARVTYWGALAGAALWLYARGASGAVEDLRTGVGYIVDLFSQEYAKAQKMQGGQQQQQAFKAGGRGAPASTATANGWFW